MLDDQSVLITIEIELRAITRLVATLPIGLAPRGKPRDRQVVSQVELRVHTANHIA